jgi:hypothetical protein
MLFNEGCVPMKKQAWLVVYLLLAISTLASFSLVSASAPAGGTLPPRPTAIPTAAPTATPVPVSTTIPNTPTGGLILLRASLSDLAGKTYWTEVEWQNAQGKWYRVDGWRGHFNQYGEVVWWVAPENFGEKPFRWVVYQSETNKKVVFTSASFALPTQTNQVILTTAFDD